MKVAVLGAGVIGVTTAYFLAQAGHDVLVIDRQSGPALETSFANAGEISPGYASPWAAPDVPAKALRWLLMKHAPLRLRPRADPHLARWLARFLRNCESDRYATNKRRMGRLAAYSREQLALLRAATGVRYDERMGGTLQLFRKPSQLEAVATDMEVLRAEGVPFEVLDRAGCIAAEPGLAFAQAGIAGGLRLPEDETGDCHKFTTALAALAERAGARFRFETRIQRLLAEGDRIEGVLTDHGPLSADAYVVALGSFSPGLTRTLRLDLPVYPVKGYSITAPLVEDTRAPVSTLLDETYKIAITRLGDRIRVGGMAEIGGFGLRLPKGPRATLVHCVESLFPGAGDTACATYWTGLRPMTPDGTPVIGPTRFENLWLNTGHGTLGWTMACGSARIVTDLICGHQPEIRSDDLALARYAA